MAKTLNGAMPLYGSSRLAHTLQTTWTLRLAFGFVITLGSFVSLIGTGWDLQWHALVGRDRTLIPPHLMMLSGILMSGLFALLAVLVENSRARRNVTLIKHNTRFASLFYSPLGAYIAGFAALDSAIGFPLDTYWHSLYGIDVTLWAPFHLMIIASMAIIPLGAAHMLISAGQIASRSGDQQAARIGNIVALIALGTMWGTLTVFLWQAMAPEDYIHVAGSTINLFPLLSGLLVAWMFTTVHYALPYRRAALYMALVFLAYMLLFSIFVPPATNLLVGMEQLHYRANMAMFANISVLALGAWPLAPILLAPLFDFIQTRSQQRGWSQRKHLWLLALASLIACLPFTPGYPMITLTMISNTLVVGTLATFLLGLLGILAGIWLGRGMGETLRGVEKA